MIDIHWLGFTLWIFLAFGAGWALATLRANRAIREISNQMDPVIGQSKALAKMTAELSAGYKTDRAEVEELRRQVAALKATEGNTDV
jgi:hypothetical protein